MRLGVTRTGLCPAELRLGAGLRRRPRAWRVSASPSLSLAAAWAAAASCALALACLCWRPCTRLQRPWMAPPTAWPCTCAWATSGRRRLVVPCERVSGAAPPFLFTRSAGRLGPDAILTSEPPPPLRPLQGCGGWVVTAAPGPGAWHAWGLGPVGSAGLWVCTHTRALDSACWLCFPEETPYISPWLHPSRPCLRREGRREESVKWYVYPPGGKVKICAVTGGLVCASAQWKPSPWSWAWGRVGPATQHSRHGCASWRGNVVRNTLACTPVALADVQATRDAHAVGDGQRRCRERLSVSAETAWLLARTDPFGRARPAFGGFSFHPADGEGARGSV